MNSFITRKVIEATEKALADIDKQREERKNDVIKQYGYTHKYFNVFGPKVYGSPEEQLKVTLNSYIGSSEYVLANSYMGSKRHLIQDIQKVALALQDRCTNNINLTTQEFGLIASFYEGAA